MNIIQLDKRINSFSFIGCVYLFIYQFIMNYSYFVSVYTFHGISIMLKIYFYVIRRRLYRTSVGLVTNIHREKIYKIFDNICLHCILF